LLEKSYHIPSSYHITTMSKLLNKLINAAYECQTDQDIATLKQVIAECNRNDIPLSSETYSQQNALTVATGNGNYQAVELLLAMGMDPNIKTAPGYTPLMYIRKWDQRYQNCVTLLLAYGADVNAIKQENETILHCISFLPKHCLFEYTKILLDLGININAQDVYGRTILYNMFDDELYKKDPEVFNEYIKLLLDHGADPNIASNWGRTPLMSACRIRATECVAMLLSHGANVNTRDEYKNSVLSYVLEKDNYDHDTKQSSLSDGLSRHESEKRCVQLLFDHGIVINDDDVKGLDYCMSFGMYMMLKEYMGTDLGVPLNVNSNYRISGRSGNTTCDAYNLNGVMVKLVEKTQNMTMQDDPMVY